MIPTGHYPLTTQDDLLRISRMIVNRLSKTERIGLSGSLGAGKTTLVQTIAKQLGVNGAVDSPTFVLRQSYPIPNHPTVQRLIHVDLYRLDQVKAIEELGLEDDWNQPGTLLLIEWIDRWPAALNQLTNHFILTWNPDTNERKLEVY